MIKRNIYTHIKQGHFIHRKMLFLTGPRQVGKTTFAKEILKERKSERFYYNWDDTAQRKRFLKDPYPFLEDLAETRVKNPLIVLDEIHKFPRWKNYLKGLYDSHGEELDIMVTGSGRLDIYRKGADSLFGRYFLYHLLPLTLGEVVKKKIRFLDPEKIDYDFGESTSADREAMEMLYLFGGFPEPFIRAKKDHLRRWCRLRKELILRQDMRDLTHIRNISLVESLIELLPERVGSPLSINSLREDIEVSHETISNWLESLKRLYYLFSIPPFARTIKRSIKKENKFYFFDWSDMDDQGKRFENLIAVHLLKAANFWTDFGFSDIRLAYIRDKEKREVDFLLLKDKRPWILVEAKISDTEPAGSLRHFMNIMRLKRTFQIIRKPNYHRIHKIGEGYLHVLSSEIFLKNFP